MRTLRFLGALLLGTALSTLANPSATASSVAEVQVGQGGSAVVEFVSIEGCLQRSVFVFATGQSFKQGAGPFNSEGGALLIVSATDVCQGTQKYDYGSFETLDLKFNNVRTATLRGTALAYDINDPASTTSYAVSLDFVQTGATRPGTAHFNYQWSGGQTIYHGVGFFAPATATGSVVAEGTSLNVIEGMTGNGTLDQHREGAVQILRS